MYLTLRGVLRSKRTNKHGNYLEQQLAYRDHSVNVRGYCHHDIYVPPNTHTQYSLTGSPSQACNPLRPRPCQPGRAEPPACFSDELTTDDATLGKLLKLPLRGQWLYDIQLTVLLLRQKPVSLNRWLSSPGSKFFCLAQIIFQIRNIIRKAFNYAQVQVPEERLTYPEFLASEDDVAGEFFSGNEIKLVF